ncbi:MAG TPA: Zn-ribbon domain-containing OB-fold protein [Acidimicrobiales bacterium]|nr:Zn-ribbon domain-containing OB-fold protein [Acidimicrobiales bacterium]
MSALRPAPAPTVASAPYWQALHDHRLVAPRCLRCGTLFFYPRARCPRCLHDGLEWVPLSGQGRVYSTTVVRQALHPAFVDEVPYAFAVVELDEGIRMPTNIIDCDPAAVGPDDPVEVVFVDVDDDLTLPMFRPARS